MNKQIKITLWLLLLPTLFIPSWVPTVFLSIFSIADFISVGIWPSSVLFDERNFLFGIWLGSFITASVMIVKSWKSKKPVYLLSSLSAIVVASVLTVLIVPQSELESRRRIVLYDIEHYQWKSYQTDSFSKLADIDMTVFSQPQRALFLLKQISGERENLSRLGYLDEDMTAATNAVSQYLAHSKGTTEYEQAAKTISYYGDWLLDQPNIVIAKALSSLTTADDNQLNKNGMNAVLSAPLIKEAWQTRALAYIQRQTDDMGIENAMASLMIAEMLQKEGEIWRNERFEPSNELTKLVNKAIDELPENKRKIYQILQARAIEDNAIRHKQPVPKDVALLANQYLPVKNAIKPSASKELDMKSMMNKSEVGTVTVDSPREIQNYLEIKYPEIKEYIAKSDVVVSVDVNTQGYLTGLWVQQGSSVDKFNQVVLENARFWRFMPSNEAYRLLITVHFDNTRLGWSEYISEQQSPLIAMVRAYARQDPKAITQAHDAFTKTLKRSPNYQTSYEPYSPYSARTTKQKDPRTQVQAILKEMQTLPSSENNHISWDNSLAFLNEKLAENQDNAEVIRMVARFELQYYNIGTHLLTQSPEIYPQDAQYWQTLLYRAREHFAQAIAVDPDREDVWLGWGMTWLDEDPEMAAGAFAVAVKLKTTEKVIALMQSLEMRMVMRTLEGARLERYQTLRARMDMRYIPDDTDVNPSDDYLSSDLTQIELAQRPIPASEANTKVTRRLLTNTDNEISNRLFSIDFSSTNIKSSNQVLPKVNASENAPKMGDIILQIDIDPKGIPTVVMIKSGSGNTQIDDAVIDAAYLWRFEPTSKGSVVLISVQFNTPKTS